MYVYICLIQKTYIPLGRMININFKKQINIIHTCLYSDGNKDAHWQEHEQNMMKL